MEALPQLDFAPPVSFFYDAVSRPHDRLALTAADDLKSIDRPFYPRRYPRDWLERSPLPLLLGDHLRGDGS
jgi:hypothetical protein